MSVEDAGLIRGIPNMMIVEPADGVQLKSLLPQIAAVDNPVYMRLARKSKDQYFEQDTEFELGKIYELRSGNDVTIICSGILIKNSLEAAELLGKEGIHARVLNMHTLKPVDSETIIKAAKETGAVVTAENHSIINGWGSAVSEVLTESYPVPLERIGIRDHFGEVGLTDFLLKKYKMTAEDIVDTAKKAISRKGRENDNHR
jgi:transketolase